VSIHGSSNDRSDGTASSVSQGGNDTPNDTPERPAPVRAERRPYVAPAIEETSDFETLALACAGSPVLCDPDDPVEPQEPSS
jgi:hypothetical protein